jgi:hypothetical protein
MPDTLPPPPPPAPQPPSWFSRLSPEVRAALVTLLNAGIILLLVRIGIAQPAIPPIVPQQQPAPLVLVVGGQVSQQPVPAVAGK